MKTSLLKGLDDKGVSNVRSSFASDATFRKALSGLLGKRVNNAFANMRKVESYDNPSWAFTQADTIGYTRALTEVINLLQSEEK